jgi:hypothetical protein
MWATDWAESTFVVDYPEPPTPIVSLQWLPAQGAVEVGLENPPGDPEVVSNDLYRSTDGGMQWGLVGTGLPVNATVLDYESPSVGEVRYRAVAWSALPSAEESEETLTIPRRYDGPGYLSAGAGYTQVARALYDLQVTEDGGLERVQQRFDGRPDPVEFSGVARTLKLDITFVTLPAEDEPEAELVNAWRELAQLRGPHLWRDAEGRVVYGTISRPTFTPAGEGAYTVTFTLTQTGRR